MLFNSWQFFYFFPIVTFIYFLLPHKFRWFWLLLASCQFYMAFVPVYILILGLTIVVDYFAAIQIEKSSGRKKDFYLYFSIVVTCLILFYFKYYNFFIDNFSSLAHFLGWNYSLSTLKILLPIGLSFHTFQSLSYVIEVYRGAQKAERHFGIYSLYVMFYPQLVAGPIERPQNLLHQFHEEHQLSPQKIASGLRLMAWGLFKKVVIADRLALIVDPVFTEPYHYSPGLMIVAILSFTFQVYCDFSGYSDMAIGAARVMGFDLMKNFNRPYAARSLSDFWKRWHISLSTWLRDYVYTPIAISARHYGQMGIALALIVTFFVSGLWHGASWNFIIWGILHGVALTVEMLTIKKLMPNFLFQLGSFIITFSFINFSYIFFRSSSLANSKYIIKSIFNRHIFSTFYNDFKSLFENPIFVCGGYRYFFSISISFVLLMEIFEWIFSKEKIVNFLSRSALLRFSGYLLLISIITYYGIWFSKRDFIYFQF